MCETLINFFFYEILYEFFFVGLGLWFVGQTLLNSIKRQR
jgi:hypothetical protein